jgi:hypothetical protein
MAFTNQVLRQPENKSRTDTPHIAKIEGYWRVCRQPKKAEYDVRMLWVKAHRYVLAKNTWPA